MNTIIIIAILILSVLISKEYTIVVQNNFIVVNAIIELLATNMKSLLWLLIMSLFTKGNLKIAGYILAIFIVHISIIFIIQNLTIADVIFIIQHEAIEGIINMYVQLISYLAPLEVKEEFCASVLRSILLEHILEINAYSPEKWLHVLNIINESFKEEDLRYLGESELRKYTEMIAQKAMDYPDYANELRIGIMTLAFALGLVLGLRCIFG